MSKSAIQPEWDARPCDDNLAALKLEFERGYKHFWASRGGEPRETGFRELMQAEARSGNKKRKVKE